MKTHRSGQKIRQHSTRMIKHQLLKLMLEDEIIALPEHTVFAREASPAITALKKLWAMNPHEPYPTRY